MLNPTWNTDLRRLLAERGWWVTGLALAARISPDAAEEIVNEHREPTLNEALRISAALEAPCLFFGAMMGLEALAQLPVSADPVDSVAVLVRRLNNAIRADLGEIGNLKAVLPHYVVAKAEF